MFTSKTLICKCSIIPILTAEFNIISLKTTHVWSDTYRTQKRILYCTLPSFVIISLAYEKEMNIQCNTVAVLLIYTSRKNYEAEEFSSGASHKKRLRKGVAKSLEHFSPSNFSIGFNLFHRFHEIFGELVIL